jgi:AhpD family alkylhydroperoxidase
MEPRINPMRDEVGSKRAKRIIPSRKVITDSALPKAVQELVNIRASQPNGCGGCLDIHTKDAAAAGESVVRINLAGAWRETTVYTEAGAGGAGTHRAGHPPRRLQRRHR